MERYYAYGITQIKLGTYITASAICMTPGVGIYAFAGGPLASAGLAKASIYLSIAAIFFVLVSLLSNRLKKRFLGQRKD